MEPRIFWFITVFVGLSTFAILALDLPPLTETEAPTSEEEKVLSECRHPNYKTYIKCLKRQKRHHLQHGDGHGEIDARCVETCLKKCESDDSCGKNCDNHCTRRTKHRHQIITEYEVDCSSGHCVEKDSKAAGSGVTNITTNIGINNIINNCQPCAPGSRSCPCVPANDTETIGRKRTETCTDCSSNNILQSAFSSQLTLVPQMTLGIGIGAGISPCMYTNQWPCQSHRPAQEELDCSVCDNPFLRYKCSILCFSQKGISTQSGKSGACISPQCVGGS